MVRYRYPLNPCCVFKPRLKKTEKKNNIGYLHSGNNACRMKLTPSHCNVLQLLSYILKHILKSLDTTLENQGLFLNSLKLQLDNQLVLVT